MLQLKIKASDYHDTLNTLKKISTPQYILWEKVQINFQEKFIYEYKAFEDRKFRCDMAYPLLKIAIEVEGFEYHGRHLNQYKKDRFRSNYFAMYGWIQLRFTASMIYKDIDYCIDLIKNTIINLEKKP